MHCDINCTGYFRNDECNDVHVVTVLANMIALKRYATGHINVIDKNVSEVCLNVYQWYILNSRMYEMESCP